MDYSIILFDKIHASLFDTWVSIDLVQLRVLLYVLICVYFSITFFVNFCNKDFYILYTAVPHVVPTKSSFSLRKFFCLNPLFMSMDDGMVGSSLLILSKLN